MAIYRIRHETVYRYKGPVGFGEHRMMLRPRESLDQRTLEYRLDIDPFPASLTWWEDASGNAVAIARFDRQSTELRITAHMAVAQEPIRPDALRIDDYARTTPFSYGQEDMPDLARFVERQLPDPDHAVDRFAREVLAGVPGEGTWGFLTALNTAIRHDFRYMRRLEPGIQLATETLSTRRGSCRDFAVLMCEAVRSQGLAARFVSGYLYVPPRNDRAAEAGGNTHAWLQVFLPGAGWIDFDPTSGTVGNQGLIRAATVRDPATAIPLGGSYLGLAKAYLGMDVNVDVARDEDVLAVRAA